jgi:hypothetical protein
MRTRTRHGGLALAAGTVLTLVLGLLALAPAPRAVAAEALSVNLAQPAGPATGVGEGFLYGISQDGSQPPASLLSPLKVNAFRGGGHVTGGWIGDNYADGSGTATDVSTVIAQAKRLGPGVQYQVLLSDIYGADGGQPSNTMYP